MKYNTYSYIYPPRPKNCIPPNNIKMWDNGMMIAQPKMNGSNCLIFTDGKQVFAMNRHSQRLTNFQLSKEEILGLYKPDMSGWLVINGEYMNKSKLDEKGLVFNHKLIIFDILVWNGYHLVGKSFQERIELLDNLYGTDQSEKQYLFKVSENVYRVKTYESDFTNLYNNLIKIDMYEGLVMKRKSAKLELGTTENNNSKSQVKARKATKNYKF